MLKIVLFSSQAAEERIHLCVINPIFKITIFRMTIEVPSRVIALTDSAQFLQRLQPVRHVAAFLHASPAPVF